MRAREILEKARGRKPGDVSRPEIEYVRKILRDREGDIQSALLVIGLCGDKGDAELVEAYLYNEDRNVFGGLALTTLVRHMGLVAEYRIAVRKLILEESETFEQSRMTALHLADEYFDGYEDPSLGCAILQIMFDTEDSDRSSARLALVRILGIEHTVEHAFSVNFDNYDDDSLEIASKAAEKFGCPFPIVGKSKH
ncbi:hypothetical protein ASD00_36540 [Ensifer sp. Root31]|uniref:hypothetical protein n=1 Tax=Ensifer sp. Root31 TaxID=1736512 RepID=UPI00070CFAC7|nr:hypothetical protein [Ensifer sp. Root31]KQU79356.1 hypothetical protein ASD00_36540 [Ensifer sp. Root31]